MFGRLKDAIDKALASLERRTGGPEQDVEELLRGMREELVAARTRLPELEALIRKLEASRVSEERKAEDCARRALQAEKIQDRETIEVAMRFRDKHLSRAEVITQKLEAARADLDLQKKTTIDMTRQLKSAIARRDSLLAQSRRARATESLRGSGRSSTDEFDRLAEQIENEGAMAKAHLDLDLGLDDDLDDAVGGSGSAGWNGPGEAGEADSSLELDPEARAERQLEELKRRMSEDAS